MSKISSSDSFVGMTPQALSPGPCTLRGLIGYNRGALVEYLMLFDRLPTLDDSPLMVLAIAPGDNFSFPIDAEGVEVGSVYIVVSSAADTYVASTQPLVGGVYICAIIK